MDMGLDTVPLKSVNRIVADKMRSGKLTVLDGDFTKKMIRAELQEALARRDRDMMELVRLDQTLDKLAREPGKAKAHNKRLPKELRVSPLAKFTAKGIRTAAGKILDAKRGALSDDLMERSTRASLQRIMDATDAKVVLASEANTRDPVRKAELPSQEAARLLNEAAREEMAILEEGSKIRRQRTKYRVGLALNGWRDIVGPPRPTIEPAMAMALEAATQQEVSRTPQTRPAQTTSKPAEQQWTRSPEGFTIKGQTVTVAEFNSRVTVASQMTSAFFASLHDLPYAERLQVIDAWHPTAMRQERERKSREAADELINRQEASPPGGIEAVGSAMANPARTLEVRAAGSSKGGVPSPRTLMAGHVPEAAPEKTETPGKLDDTKRRKRKRKAILARQRRDEGRGR